MNYNFFLKFCFAHLSIFVEFISLYSYYFFWSKFLCILLNNQILDKNCLGPLKKAYCCSLNLLLRREVWITNTHTVLMLFFFISWQFGVKIMLWLALEHFMNWEVTTVHVEIFTDVITCTKSRFWNKNCKIKSLVARRFMKCLGHCKYCTVQKNYSLKYIFTILCFSLHLPQVQTISLALKPILVSSSWHVGFLVSLPWI